MNYTTHKLNTKNHSHIIGRQDSVTGDSVQENDSVVFCAICQSVFLVDSWEYMNRTHCNQSQTLDFVPKITPVLIAQKKPRGKNVDGTLITEFSSKRIESLLNSLPIVLISFLSSTIVNKVGKDEYLFITFSIIIVASLFLGIFIKNVVKKDKVRIFLKLDKKTIRIFDTGIELQNERFYSYAEIEKIEYIREEYPNFFYHRNKKYVVIYLKNGEVITQKVPSKSYLKTKPLFFALGNAAKFVEVHFQTKDKNELGLARSIERNYTGRVFTRYSFPQIEGTTE